MPYSIRLFGVGVSLLLHGCAMSSSDVRMINLQDGAVRECPRGSSTWQNEAIREQLACIKAYEDAGYVRLGETSFPMTQVPMSENKVLPSAGLPVAEEGGASQNHEAALVDQLRKIRDARNRGLISDAEYKLRCDEIIEQL